MRAVGALVAVLLLAGCTDSGGADGDDGGAFGAGGRAAAGAASPGGAGAGAAGLSMQPVGVGDWWNFTVKAGDTEWSETYVVSAQDATTWRLDTGSLLASYYDARFDVSFLGPTRKADLAGSQGSAWVEFFRWPLREGASWTTTWDAESKTITVARVAGDVAHLVATNATGKYASYTYDAAARWFGQITFYLPDGRPDYELRLARSGGDYNGPLVRMEVSEAFRWEGSFTEPPILKQFAVAPETTDVRFEVQLECTQGFHVMAAGKISAGRQLAPGSNSEGPCPAAVDLAYDVPSTPDEDKLWGAMVGGGPASAGTFSVAAFARVIEQVEVKQ